MLTEATKQIRHIYDLYEMTLQVEEFQNDMVACDQCHDPVVWASKANYCDMI